MCHLFAFSEIDNDGVIEPDTDEPQEMGDFENIEVKFILSMNNAHIYLFKHFFSKGNSIPGITS